MATLAAILQWLGHMPLTIENLDKLKQSLIWHEGLRFKPYADTGGKLTIGVGHNLTDNGLSPNVVNALLDEDIEAARVFVEHHFSWVSILDDVRKRVFVELAFNLGGRLLEFHDTIAAAQRGDWSACVTALTASAWHTQVGHRAITLETMLLTGLDATT